MSSNYLGRKAEFKPAVYTRYFEHTDASPAPHLYFNDTQDNATSSYQIKRDLIFKRLFPSRYSDANSDNAEEQQQQQRANENGQNTSANSAAQVLGDFIPLSNNHSLASDRKARSSPDTDVTLSSSDEIDEDSFVEAQLPIVKHKSIVGHIHSRTNIEHVRTVLIRELYERTSDSHTEWLKCKMSIPRQYVNPKYYADFQRRYRHEIQRNALKTKKKAFVSRRRTDDSSRSRENSATSIRTMSTSKTNDTSADVDVIETISRSTLPKTSSLRDMPPAEPTTTPARSIPEYIVLDDDDDDDDNRTPLAHSTSTDSIFFVDRLSTSGSQSRSSSRADYHEDDSKYSQLPSHSKSTPAVIRPIISKNQRRKQKNNISSSSLSTPLVSAIDRIIDHMDRSDSLSAANLAVEQILRGQSSKKRKKKKKKQPVNE